MKIVFFGTSPFAADVLSSLVENNVTVCSVVTKVDKQKGRGRKVSPPPVKVRAQELLPNTPIHQPVKASTPEFADILKSYDADLFIVVAYGEIIKQNILDIPKLCCINVHASLLPKYRGAAPIQRCIIDGEKESGIAIMKMVLALDAGDVFNERTVSITPNMTAGELEQALCSAGCEALVETIHAFEGGEVPSTPQDESKVTYAHKIKPEDCQIDWNLPAQEVHNLIRGVTPIPGAWFHATIKGKPTRIKASQSTIESVTTSLQPGVIQSFDKKGLVVSCGSDAIRITSLQLEGKKMMPVSALLNGLNPADLTLTH